MSIYKPWSPHPVQILIYKMLQRGDLYGHMQIHVVSNERVQAHAWPRQLVVVGERWPAPMRGPGSWWLWERDGPDREYTVGIRSHQVFRFPTENGSIQMHIELCAAAIQSAYFTYMSAYRSAVRPAYKR
jgi:hypothetical protein